MASKRTLANPLSTQFGSVSAPPALGCLQQPTTPEAHVDIMGQLKQLGELRDAGVLTEDEFTAKKTELLDRL